MSKRIEQAKESLLSWAAEVEEVVDEADNFVYYDRSKRRSYDDGYMAWNTEYTYPERSASGWQVACMKDGEIFWNKQRSEAMAMCERHICNDHVTKEVIKHVQPENPPF